MKFSVVNTGLLIIPEDYTIEEPVIELVVLKLLKARKVKELYELYVNWTTESE
jgi:hypothetical protein